MNDDLYLQHFQQMITMDDDRPRISDGLLVQRERGELRS